GRHRSIEARAGASWAAIDCAADCPYPVAMSDDPNRDRPGAWRRVLPELVLVLATMAWGGTFLAVQTGLAVSGPLFFVGSRFAVAALAAGAGAPWGAGARGG